MPQPANKRVVTEASAVLAGKAAVGHTHSGDNAGESAYEVAVRNGFVGAEADWLASLVGDGAAPASTTVAGVSRHPTTAELTAGTATNLTPTVANLSATIAAHRTEVDPHPALGEAITEVQQALGGKANSPVLPEDIEGSSALVTANSVVIRDAAGRIAAAAGVADTDVATVKQARDLAEFVSGADVRDLEATGLPLTLSTSASTWTTLGGVLVPDAATGHEWECELAIKYQAEPGSGIKFRHKGGTAAATNLLTAHNPSFESTDLSSWAISSNATFTRGTAGGGSDGAAYGIITATTAGNLILMSPYVPIGSATRFAAGFRARLGVGTARNTRVDILYATDAFGAGAGGWDLGMDGATFATAGAWASPTIGNSGGGETSNLVGATHARIRVVYVSAVIGDAVHVDAAQFEPSSPLPAFGSTGGSGASALEVTGEYRGLSLLDSAGGNPTLDDYRRRVGIRTPAVAFTAAEFGGLGTTVDAEGTASLRFTIVGTALTGQRLEFEAAPRATATVAPKIVAARAVFARVL